MSSCLHELVGEKGVEAKINKIRLEFNNPSCRDKIWVLVEGGSDQKLFSKLVDGKHVKVEVVPGGVESLRKAVKVLTEKIDCLLGIRDADFLRMDNERETIKCLFMTDGHDAEIMIVMCDEAFKSLVAEFKNDRLADFQSLREELFVSIKFLSGVRWKNSLEGLELNFNGLGFLGSFFDKESKEFNIVDCLR